MNFEQEVTIGKSKISQNSPVYFIADIAANHDGDFQRAKDLIWLAKESGADAVKFQHFRANKIVSDFGFKALGSNIAHQSKWDMSVFQVYEKYECDINWTSELVAVCEKAKIDFLTTPYDLEVVKSLDHFLPAYKIGSGDITWLDFIEYIAELNKPVLLATGASDLDDVRRAVMAVLKSNRKLILMQCNTNYTGSLANFKYINLPVLNTFSKEFPGVILGLSDHSPGHATVLGSIALGARVIEKHFTDSNDRKGPDHLFSMNPKSWRDMIDRSRELESALGDGIKRIEENELESAVVQRRSIRSKRRLEIGHIVTGEDVEFLRPAPIDSCPPHYLPFLLNRRLVRTIDSGDIIRINDLETK